MVVVPLVFVVGGNLEVVGFVVGVAVVGVSCVAVDYLVVVFGGVVSFVVRVVAVGREEEVGLPAFDGFDGDVAGESCVFVFVFSGFFFE